MRPEKQFLLDEIEGQLKAVSSFVILRYQSLNANMANDFRREVAKSGGNLEVVRKRILWKAAQAAGISLDLEALDGHIGLVFSGKDPIETTKVVFKFKKNAENTLEVLGGRFDGMLYSGADVEALSQLPSKEEMRAQFLGVLEAPMAHMLAVQEALLTSVVYCLDNKSKQEGIDQ
jgi:large subunit ribosomal protein L10